MFVGVRSLLPEILGQADPVAAKTPIFIQYEPKMNIVRCP